MLEKFRAAKAPAIKRLKELEAAEKLPMPLTDKRPSFSDALLAHGPIAVIAEYKRASPSAGDINLGLAPEDVAALYAAAGAAAISVLTEETYFKGSLDSLEAISAVGLPMLRKDFLLHPLQVAETAATKASALLLIARMLTDPELSEMLALTYDAGLEAVVEVFDEADLNRAEAAGARIIQVNNRDLDTLETDLAVSRRMVARKRPGRIWISASGITSRADVLGMATLGYNAVLVGTSIMAAPDPGAALAILTGKEPS
ncbi:Indole-3-glycerol-phosphate synthase [Solidesulfovibrio carbinoliphilus subsp. oakridgensis]|uniref:indole-3-glycerol-phosphate synthase n=1 Tax=Solidesulfovibrio carbinoliphilus subsp. oakridgensis TaxID=694327 RepID=G7QAV0_9BACT|nr:indole-3-glycerol-phosphate synthase [Solidesulfovibrio carbinoliphilus]EHJ48291.1 Indole-3-glycerol-phosphate synthase [Solidesulfovibrio carbinoliphilus subsp. oakridgensis]